MNIVQQAFDLTGRVAIITGGARGIGRGGATVLGEAGAHVVIVDVLGDQAKATAAELADQGISCEAAQVDVSHKSEVDALIAEVAGRHGRIDIMVNNAAIITDSSPMEVTEEELDRVHAVNFKGVIFGSQAAARAMIPKRRGSIINITSGAVDSATPFVIAYSTAKAATAQYSRSLAAEIGKHNVPRQHHRPRVGRHADE